MDTIFCVWQSFKVKALRFDKFILEFFNLELIVTLDIEVANSEESIDDVNFFSFLCQDNKGLFRGNEVRENVDNGPNIR